MEAILTSYIFLVRPFSTEKEDMELAMNKIEELFSAAKDEVKKKNTV